MMGLMQQYFKFTGGIICGLPSVQLLGQRDDWAALLDKLGNLHHFGAEPAQCAKNLDPILTMFVKTWDEPKSKQVQDFWKQIVGAEKTFTCGAGPVEYDISGWIAGFMYWSSNGDLRVPAGVPAAGDTVLDGITYHRINLSQLPVGYATVSVKMLDYPTRGTNSMAYAPAGNIGIAWAETSKAGEPRRGVLTQPLSAVWTGRRKDNAGGSRYRSRDELVGIYHGFRTNCPTGGGPAA